MSRTHDDWAKILIKGRTIKTSIKKNLNLAEITATRRVEIIKATASQNRHRTLISQPDPLLSESSPHTGTLSYQEGNKQHLEYLRSKGKATRKEISEGRKILENLIDRL